ncbi:Uncharacterized protein FWK35_00009271 [Aphis craccivora]|uniref:Uncharacterized protein n=1 Tax=Aphis craccivora TaxID=307492 RepID=A0A6G0ZCZ4_APHCR|nr:Uncharacterized protein FWK35_00009271 [Aphis craccivora]
MRFAKGFTLARVAVVCIKGRVISSPVFRLRRYIYLRVYVCVCVCVCVEPQSSRLGSDGRIKTVKGILLGLVASTTDSTAVDQSAPDSMLQQQYNVYLYTIERRKNGIVSPCVNANTTTTTINPIADISHYRQTLFDTDHVVVYSKPNYLSFSYFCTKHVVAPGI